MSSHSLPTNEEDTDLFLDDDLDDILNGLDEFSLENPEFGAKHKIGASDDMDLSKTEAESQYGRNTQLEAETDTDEETEENSVLSVLEQLRVRSCSETSRPSHIATGGTERGSATRGVSRDPLEDEEEEEEKYVERILAQVREEIGLGRETHAPRNVDVDVKVVPNAETTIATETSTDAAPPPPPTTTTTTVGAVVVAATAADTASNAPLTLQLPSVPSSQPLDDATPVAEPVPDEEGGRKEARKSTDFENDIAARLASLRGLGSGVNLDAFGFPTAPVFRPEDRTASTAASLVTSREKVGFTDEDQKTWCIVCLDNANVRCVDCDNDVYCRRCWKDMVISSLFSFATLIPFLPLLFLSLRVRPWGTSKEQLTWSIASRNISRIRRAWTQMGQIRTITKGMT